MEEKNVPMLSTGVPSTLGSWVDLCEAIFGHKSKPTLFMKEKMEKQGRDEPVVADEGQLLMVLGNMFVTEMRERGD